MAGASPKLHPDMIRLFPFLFHAYNPNTPHALVVSFHGFKSNALKQERITGLSEAGVLINGKGIVAVYLEGQFRQGKNGIRVFRRVRLHRIRRLASIAAEPPPRQPLPQFEPLLRVGKEQRGGCKNLLAWTPQTANLFASFAPVSPALYAGANPMRPYLSSTYMGYRIVSSHLAGRTSERSVRFWPSNLIYYESDARDDPDATPNIAQFRETWAERNGWGSAGKVRGIVKLSSAISSRT
ncbi:hypothetical protein C8F01DRAFT_1256855 [Mycena amicta]|nr:hypothetical protein C8F01DRAFT_1256855 [Mycena amicta]